MNKVWICALLMAVATPALGQDLRSVSILYLDEVLAASAAQAALGNRETAPEFLGLIGDDHRWMNPVIKPGIGAVIGHMALFGAEGFAIGEPQIAKDAARVPATVRYRDTPGFEWSVNVDFIQTHGEWKLRAIRLVERRPLSTDAEPKAVLRTWLANLIAAAERQKALDDKSWLFENLNRHWAFGGGYWRRETDCTFSERVACLTAKASASGLWTASILDREKTISLEDFSMTPEGAKGTFLVEIPRRTTNSRQLFAVTLKKDRRYGWQIASLERLGQTPEPEPAEISADTSSGETLVRSLVAAILGENAPTTAQMLANPDILASYFAETREGRKALAQFLTMSSIVVAIGADPSQAQIEDLGSDRLRLSFKGSRISTFAPVLVITETVGGAKIAGIETQ
ncbi:MAG: hypothetical protein K8F59_15885 [Rhodobacteraceae bacterium]|nr:hypothetical protein [Paracoccaceae bacterium]